MNFTRIYAIFLRQVFLIWGNPTRALHIFVWTGLDIILWGFTSKYLNSVSETGFSFIATLLGAVLLWNFLTRVMQGITMAFFEDVWTRNFLNIFSSPLSIVEYLSGLVLTGIFSSFLALVFMTLLAGFIFGLWVVTLGATLIMALLILFLFGVALGIWGVAIVLRYGPSGEWFVWPLPFLISPFVGVFYPLAALPGWMQTIAQFLAPSYVFEAVRSISMGQLPSMPDLFIGLAISGITVICAYFVFIVTYNKALKNGRIARYSAEGAE